MPTKQLQGVIHHLRRTFGARGLREVPDAELLKRFRADRDEAAFELLVWRHGKMVFNVCRRICRDGPDAEDAFQAAFLTLVRKAGAIRQQESVGGWLYKVAYRAAQMTRVRVARQSQRTQAADLDSVPGSLDPASAAAWREVRLLIDDELHRLPEKYRLPFVLCHLEGHSNADAARLLGCPVGTVESRLTRARQRLRSGLTRRGVAFSAGLSAALLTRHVASASVPTELVLGTAKAALVEAGGQAAAGLISAKVATLTEGVLKTMFVSKLKTAASLLLTVGILAGAAGGWTYRSMAVVAAAADDDPSKITTKDADADQIAKLIEQLGTDTFADREAASRGLERLGAAALEGLRKAAQSNDVETRRRAEVLVKKIEKDLTSRELLQAKHVSLRFKDAPLPEAVAELAKQSGYEIALDDPDGKLKERTVTLDTGDVPFWRAVDLLCKAGNLVEADSEEPMFAVGGGVLKFPGVPGAALPAMPMLPGVGGAPAGGALPPAAKPFPAAPAGPAPGGDANPFRPAPDAKPAKETEKKAATPGKPAQPAGGNAPAAAPPDGKIAPPKATQPAAKAPPAAAPPGGNGAKVPVLPVGGIALKQFPAGGPGGGFMLKAPPVAGVNAPLAVNKLILKDGKTTTSPTAYAGAARVRAVNDAKHTPAAGEGESAIGLQISLEPKLVWRRLNTLRLDKAVDDQGQVLDEAAAPANAPAAGNAGPFGPGGGVAFMLPPDSAPRFFGGANLYASIRLKKGEKPAKMLKELKGTLTAEIFGPIKPLITVNNLLKAAGKTIKGKDGASLEVLEVIRGEDDQITVKLALDPPADWAPGGVAVAGVAAVMPPLAAPGGALPALPPAGAKVPPPPAAPAVGAIVMGFPASAQHGEITLVDSQGKAVQTTRHTVNYRAGDKGFTHLHEYTLHLPKEPVTIKLVFSGRRSASIDVPFTLMDISLP
jgi:RNA polymerase sigma factor (sigma-70 family)